MDRISKNYSVKGVRVCPTSRTSQGVEMFISNGLIERIELRPEITHPFILPGFIDAHVHIESSMMVPAQFAKMAVRHGTVAVVTDPHEVANVAGIEGIRFMQQNAKSVPLKFFFGVPSCVPASPLEKSGATLTAEDVERLIQEDDFYFLAEMMNFPGVIFNDTEVKGKLNAALKNRKPIDGHAPGLSGNNLVKYAEAGITTDHECSTAEEALEKIKLGMKILIREGSAAKNYSSLISLMHEYGSSVMFCTDDCHPDYLEKGHINKIVARAVADGYNLYDVLRSASVNPIKHYNLPVGSLEVNQPADFVIVKDLVSFDVLETVIDGDVVFANNEISFTAPSVKPPQFYFRSNHRKNNLKVSSTGTKINIIGVIEGELITKWLVEELHEPIGSIIKTNTDDDLLKIVLLDRYSNSLPVVAFIRGFGLKQGALAVSIAHDSHHIIAIGCDDKSIDTALEWIIANRGGLCYSISTSVEGIPLPFYGLMTNTNGLEVSKEYERINDTVKENGCKLSSPFMTASFMALTVIPELKIYHNGLFDASSFKHVDLFI